MYRRILWLTKRGCATDVHLQLDPLKFYLEEAAQLVPRLCSQNPAVNTERSSLAAPQRLLFPLNMEGLCWF